MKFRPAALVLLVSVLLSACVPSVNPFYFEHDVIFDPRLVGRWQTDKSGTNHWTFEKGEGKGYTVRIRHDERAGLLEARLFRLEGQLFLDTIPILPGAKRDALEVVVSTIPGHLLFRVGSLEPHLRLEPFSYNFLREQLVKDSRALAHALTPDGDFRAITATTAELQAFVRKHLKEERLFDRPGTNDWPYLPEWRRLPDPSPPAKP